MRKKLFTICLLATAGMAVAADHPEHKTHPHQHAADCGHQREWHADHFDYQHDNHDHHNHRHAGAKVDIHEESFNLHKNHGHKHGKTCGHKAVQHSGHTDYVHDGHTHHVHGSHVHEDHHS